MNTDNEILKCPICFSIPEKEVYQCQNGHILCDKCSANVNLCPQCRVSIEGNQRSRNRVLEQLLDELTINCPFTDKGCSKQGPRKDLSAHSSACIYGKEILLCQYLFQTDCHFTVNIKNLNEVFNHLETVHKRKRLDGRQKSCVTITLNNLLETTGDVFSACCLLRFEKPWNEILLVVKKNNKFVSWLCFDLNVNGNQKDKSHLTSVNVSSNETPSISWKLPVYPFLDFEEHFENPPVIAYIPTLVKLKRQVHPEIKNSDFTIIVREPIISSSR